MDEILKTVDCICVHYDNLDDLTKQEICDYLIFQYLTNGRGDLVDFIDDYDSEYEDFSEEYKIRCHLFRMSRGKVIKLLKEYHSNHWEYNTYVFLNEVYLTNYMTREREMELKKKYFEYRSVEDDVIIYHSNEKLFRYWGRNEKSSMFRKRNMGKGTLKFYDKYNSLFEYDCFFLNKTNHLVISIPKEGDFLLHLENVRRLLEIEFGGIFEIENGDEMKRTIETNLPERIYKGIDFTSVYLTEEENNKVYKYWKYKICGESNLQTLW